MLEKKVVHTCNLGWPLCWKGRLYRWLLWNVLKSIVFDSSKRYRIEHKRTISRHQNAPDKLFPWWRGKPDALAFLVFVLCDDSSLSAADGCCCNRPLFTTHLIWRKKQCVNALFTFYLVCCKKWLFCWMFCLYKKNLVELHFLTMEFSLSLMICILHIYPSGLCLKFIIN